MTLTKIINDFTFFYTPSQLKVELYLTAIDDYLNNKLKINDPFMLVILYQTGTELSEDRNLEKEQLKDNLIKFSQRLEYLGQQHKSTKITIELIDPATGYPRDNSTYNLPERIDLPRVISRLANNCYQYQKCCHGKHQDWGEKIYPGLILINAASPQDIIAIVNQVANEYYSF